MWKLMQYEYKKLFKNRMNQCIILLVVITVVSSIYRTVENNFQINQLVSLDDQKLETTIDKWRYADEIMHNYAGEVNNELIVRKKKDFLQYKEELEKNNELDNNINKLIYGENYQEKIKLCESFEMSVEDYELWREESNIRFENLSIQSHPNIEYNKEDKIFDISLYFKNDLKMKALDNLYQEWGNGELIIEKLNDKQNRLIQYSSIFKAKEVFDKNDYELFNEITELDNSFENIAVWGSYPVLPTEKYIDALNTKYLSTTSYTDSPLGIEMFLSVFRDNVLVILLLIMNIIFFGSLFTKEKNVESNLKTTLKGNKQLTLAKITSVVLFNTFILVLIICISYGIVSMIIPIRSFNQVYVYNAFSELNAEYFVMSYLEIFIVFVSIWWISLIVTGLLSAFLSLFTNQLIFSVTVSFLLIFYPYMFQSRFWFLFTPVKMMTEQIFIYPTTMLLYEFYPKISSFYELVSKIGIFWIVVMILLCGIAYFKQRKHVL